MEITSKNIDAALVAEDIEGFIALGAPQDEYSQEAEEIASALLKLSDKQRNTENIVDTVSRVWTDHFDLAEEEIAKRKESFQRIANAIL